MLCGNITCQIRSFPNILKIFKNVVTYLKKKKSSKCGQRVLFNTLRAPTLGASQGGGLHLAAAERGLQRQRVQQLAGRGGDKNRQVRHRSSGAAARLRLHALNLSDRLHPGRAPPLLPFKQRPPDLKTPDTLNLMTSSSFNTNINNNNITFYPGWPVGAWEWLVCGHQHIGGGIQYLQGGGRRVHPCAFSGCFQRTPEKWERRYS